LASSVKKLKKLAVTTVKPHVADHVWQALRDPQQSWTERQERKSLGHKPLHKMTLDELAAHFKTDKWGHHWYTQHYARHFAHLRNEQFTLLEIGVGGYSREQEGGASLRMWKAFFPKAQIIGLDIEDKSFVDEKRIRTVKGSQTDRKILKRIVDRAGGDLRVVIDDGSHRPAHIRATFNYLFPRIAENGIYVIEDTQTSYWPSWGGSEDLSDPTTTMALVKDLVDGLHYQEFVDPDYVPTYTDEHLFGLHVYHNLVFLERGNNAEGGGGRRTTVRFKEDDPRYRPPVPVAEQRRRLTTRVSSDTSV
jgi:hypothetical protein